MAAVRFEEVASNVCASLRTTDANYAFNSHSFKVFDESITVKGFIGVRTPDSELIEGAFCWRHGSEFYSFVFDINLGGKNVAINFIEMPSQWLLGKTEQHVQALLISLQKKIHKRMEERSQPKKKKRGGSYNGPRLEAWKRDATLPENKFARFPGLFTDSFISLAPDLHVTYR